MELILCTIVGLGLGLTGFLRRRQRGERELTGRQRGELSGKQRLPRAGDVVNLPGQGQEALIEGVVRLEEPGRVAFFCQLHDGRALWLRGAPRGIDTEGGPGADAEDDLAWLLAPAPAERPAQEEAAAEEVDLGGLRYRLRLRYRAEALILSRPPRGAPHASLRAGEVLVLEYRSVGAERLLGLVQGARGGLYVGQSASQGLEILPSS